MFNFFFFEVMFVGDWMVFFLISDVKKVLSEMVLDYSWKEGDYEMLILGFIFYVRNVLIEFLYCIYMFSLVVVL